MGDKIAAAPTNRRRVRKFGVFDLRRFFGISSRGRRLRLVPNALKTVWRGDGELMAFLILRGEIEWGVGKKLTAMATLSGKPGGRVSFISHPFSDRLGGGRRVRLD